MNKKLFLLFLLILILVLNPQTALAGAVSGLNLWFNVILPTLLPFMIISYLIQNVYGSSIRHPLVYVTVIGLFCGYPMGAYAAVSMYKKKCLTRKETELLLMCCNISSPAFVLSYIAFSSLNIRTFPWELLLVNYLPVLFLLLYLFLSHQSRQTCGDVLSSQTMSPEIVDAAITNSILNVLKLGGYIIIFSILAAFISILPIKNVFMKCAFIGMAEITTGIHDTLQQEISPTILPAMILTMNAFGGLSCAFQSASFFQGTDLSIKKYIYHKFLLAVFTFLTWYLLVHVFKLSIV